LLYHVFIFTDLVPNFFIQVAAGWTFIVVMSGNMFVHVFFLLRTTLFTCKKNCRERELKKKAKQKQLARNDEVAAKYQMQTPQSKTPAKLLSQVDEDEDDESEKSEESVERKEIEVNIAPPPVPIPVNDIKLESIESVKSDKSSDSEEETQPE